jgi:hypothetical protein
MPAMRHCWTTPRWAYVCCASRVIEQWLFLAPPSVDTFGVFPFIAANRSEVPVPFSQCVTLSIRVRRSAAVVLDMRRLALAL